MNRDCISAQSYDTVSVHDQKKTSRFLSDVEHSTNFADQRKISDVNNLCWELALDENELFEYIHMFFRHRNQPKPVLNSNAFNMRLPSKYFKFVYWKIFWVFNSEVKFYCRTITFLRENPNCSKLKARQTWNATAQN